MSRKYVVSPVYEVNKELLDDIASGGVIIISDNVSPIFPVDRRETWLERTDVRRDILIDGVPTNDETDTFLMDCINKINQISYVVDKEANVDIKDVIIYVSNKDEFIKTHNIPSGLTIKQFRNPLEIKLDDLDEPFKTRFGKEFERFTSPKTKDVGQDTYVFVPVYIENDELGSKYYGVTYTYGLSEVVNLFDATMPKFETLLKIETYAKVIADRGFLSVATKMNYLGTFDNKVVIVVECEKPEWIDDNASINSNRKFIANDLDVVFLHEKHFKETSSLAYAIADSYEDYLEAKASE